MDGPVDGNDITDTLWVDLLLGIKSARIDAGEYVKELMRIATMSTRMHALVYNSPYSPDLWSGADVSEFIGDNVPSAPTQHSLSSRFSRQAGLQIAWPASTNYPDFARVTTLICQTGLHAGAFKSICLQAVNIRNLVIQPDEFSCSSELATYSSTEVIFRTLESLEIPGSLMWILTRSPGFRYPALRRLTLSSPELCPVFDFAVLPSLEFVDMTEMSPDSLNGDDAPYLLRRAPNVQVLLAPYWNMRGTVPFPCALRTLSSTTLWPAKYLEHLESWTCTHERLTTIADQTESSLLSLSEFPRLKSIKLNGDIDPSLQFCLPGSTTQLGLNTYRSVDPAVLSGVRLDAVSLGSAMVSQANLSRITASPSRLSLRVIHIGEAMTNRYAMLLCLLPNLERAKFDDNSAFDVVALLHHDNLNMLYFDNPDTDTSNIVPDGIVTPNFSFMRKLTRVFIHVRPTDIPFDSMHPSAIPRHLVCKITLSGHTPYEEMMPLEAFCNL